MGPPTRVGMWILRAFSQQPLKRACLTPSIKNVKLKVNPGCRRETMAKSSPICKSAAKTKALAPPKGCCSMRILCVRLTDEVGILFMLLPGRLDGLPVNWNHNIHRGALTGWGWEWLTIIFLLIAGSQHCLLKAVAGVLKPDWGLGLRHQA